MFWYGNDFSLWKKDTMLVAFLISTLRELKNLGPWKQIENFLKLILQWSNWRYGQKIRRFVAPLQTGYSSLAKCIQYNLSIVFKLYFICFQKWFKPLRTEFSPLCMLDVYMAHATIYMRALHLASNNNNILQRFSQHWRRVIQPPFFKYIYDFFW